MTFNARSIKHKITGVTEFLSEHNGDLCFVSEAWLKAKDVSVAAAEIRDLGYSIQVQSRKGKGGGGTCAVYKRSIDVKFLQY